MWQSGQIRGQKMTGNKKRNDSCVKPKRVADSNNLRNMTGAFAKAWGIRGLRQVVRNAMLSVCIITKNESNHLGECLKKLKKYSCEIVVVDTGSEDDSIKVAERYADKVCTFTWCDDFSAARNFAASQASNDYIVMIDTDEYVKSFHVRETEKLLEQRPFHVGRMVRCSSYYLDHNVMTSLDYTCRVYNRRNFHYEGRIHEQIVANNGKPYAVWRAPLETDHVGYIQSEEERRQKAQRNIKLLLEELENRPDDAYYLYQLGRAYMYQGDLASAAEFFEKTFTQELEPKLEWVINMMVSYGYLLISLDRKEEALRLEGLQKEFSDVADFSFMLGYVFMQNELFDEAIAFFAKAATQKKCYVEGVNSYQANYNIGVIHECTGHLREALKYYRRCGSFDKAKAGISRCIKAGRP